MGIDRQCKVIELALQHQKNVKETLNHQSSYNSKLPLILVSLSAMKTIDLLMSIIEIGEYAVS